MGHWIEMQDLDYFRVPFSFHRDIIKDFATKSGLLVMARGLESKSVIKTLVHLYADPRCLVFIIKSEREDDILDSGDEVDSERLFLETTANIHAIKTETSIKERCRIYEKGGVVILSARVFLMDLLHSRVPIPLVTGVVVLDSHRVTEYGMEAFCLYLFRKRNSSGFIKAVSDCPEALVRGFAKAEKILKTLRVSDIILYPRFHVGVNSELSHAKIDVVEICCPLTQRLRMIQISILGILESSINDICKDNSLNTDDFNVDLSVLGEFESMVQQHLDSNWHQVGFKTKQLLKEMRALRNILRFSVDYDGITFYKFLQTQVEEAQGLSYHSSAYWLLSDSANLVIEVAKERALAMELNPKWSALAKIIEECDAGRRASVASNLKPILVLVESLHSLVCLASILELGTTEFLNRMAQAFPITEKNSKKPRSESDAEEFDFKSLFTVEEYFVALRSRNIILRLTDSIDLEDLKMLCPHSIIIFTPNLKVLRTIELYGLQEFEDRVKVFFFMYSDSVEEQKYLSEIRREKESFEQLIRTKSVMAPYNEEAQVDVEFLIEDVVMKSSGFANTIAAKDEFPRKIVVDTRDLRSSLPFLLNLYGFEIEPITIPIGDYILSPNICIERKSLPDLISSLNSGRLNSQVSAMSQSYQLCALLIEFDPDKPFYLLQSRSASALRRVDLSPTDLISKLVLLLLHHPKLKLLWSSGPRITCDIFYDLKRNEPNPVNVDEHQSVKQSLSKTEDSYNTKMKEFLVKLPGINGQNFFIIMKKYMNIKELALATKDSLVESIGQENGTKLYSFLTGRLQE